MIKFNEIVSRDEIAKFFKMPVNKLTYMLYVKKIENYYVSFDIPKKNGGVRHINAPTGDLIELQRALTDALWALQKELIKESKINTNVSHGFEKKKGIITNAEVHRNKRYVLNMDFENFFDSFHFGRVRGYFEKNRYLQFPKEVATIFAQITCFERRLPQGAPSSPIITNMICNIFDMRIAKVVRKYKVDYTRYADDLTFSTNNRDFLNKHIEFCKEIRKEAELSGLIINDKKTRLLYKDSRQEVTGLTVNKKLSVNRNFYKYTRAMANNLYTSGEFEIDGLVGSIKQLEGRFAFINQIDYYNNKLDNEKHHARKLNSREKQYQVFLFYKYFFANSKPLIVTEGKTDVIYLKSAIKKYYEEYPRLIEKKDNKFEYKISFLKRTNRLEYFFNMAQDGADAMKNIYNLYTGIHDYQNCFQYISHRSKTKPINPVVLIFDNEQKTKKPLKAFLNHIHAKDVKLLGKNISINIKENLYLLTNPLNGKSEEAEIEDLFEAEVLQHEIEGKTFSRDKKYNTNKHYGKAIFSGYVAKKYKEISFNNFRPMLDELNKIVSDY